MKRINTESHIEVYFRLGDLSGLKCCGRILYSEYRESRDFEIVMKGVVANVPQKFIDRMD